MVLRHAPGRLVETGAQAEVNAEVTLVQETAGCSLCATRATASDSPIPNSATRRSREAS